MKKSEIKNNIMIVMRSYKGVEMTPTDIAREMTKWGLFVPYDNDVHIRQLYAQKRIERVKRGVYLFNDEE